MTAFDNFDRRLGAFLDDGPVRSPERPVDAAIAHALAHPRRRDPLAALRRDPMARPMLWGARPVLVFAILGLLLVMSGAAFFVGSQRQPSVVPPSPTDSPSASPSAPPSASPRPSVAPSPRTFSVVITDSNGVDKTVVVTDASGLLEQALPWEADIDRPQLGEIEVHQLPADEGGGADGLIVQWLDLSCPDDVAMTIDAAARQITVAVQSCPVDAVGTDHGVWLDFSVEVPADEVSVSLDRTR